MAIVISLSPPFPTSSPFQFSPSSHRPLLSIDTEEEEEEEKVEEEEDKRTIDASSTSTTASVRMQWTTMISWTQMQLEDGRPLGTRLRILIKPPTHRQLQHRFLLFPWLMSASPTVELGYSPSTHPRDTHKDNCGCRCSRRRD